MTSLYMFAVKFVWAYAFLTCLETDFPGANSYGFLLTQDANGDNLGKAFLSPTQ